MVGRRTAFLVGALAAHAAQTAFLPGHASQISSVVRGATERASQSIVQGARPDVRQGPALIFPGGGLFFWWQLGAVERLLREGPPSGPVVGASAGALAATLYACDVDPSEARRLALDLTVEAKLLDRGVWGLVGRWGPVVRDWLGELLPEDAADRCADVKMLHLRRRRLLWRRCAVGPYEDRDQLIDAALASAHVPFALDGRFQTRYRGRGTIDGSFLLKNPKRERRAVELALGHAGDYVRVDWRRDLPDKQRLSDAFELPGRTEGALRAWVGAVGERGYAWADRELAPGGALEEFLSPHSAVGDPEPPG